MPSNKSPSIVNAGPGRLASGQVPASALAFPVSEGDLGGRELASPTRSSLVTPGSPVASIILPAQTFVGNAPSYPLEMLFQVVDNTDRAIFNGATRVVVTSLTGATVGSGFTPGNVTLNLTPSVPTGVQYRVYYGTRSTYSTLPVDALTFDRTFGLYANAISYSSTGIVWPDSATFTATNVEQGLDNIIADLSSVSPNYGGAGKVGFSNQFGYTWADGSAFSPGTVGEALSTIVDILGTNGAPIGSGKISTSIAQPWATAGGFITVSSNIYDALNDIVQDLAGTFSVTVNGARKIGAVITNTWADATGIAATNVGDAISEIVNDLKENSPASGAGRIGLTAGSFSGALTGQGGGGLLTSNTNIQAALAQANTQLVARRTWTRVFTDGSSSIGGDANGTDITSSFGISQGGSWFFRRGIDYVITNNTTWKDHPVGWLAEKINQADTTTIRYTGGSALVMAPKHTEESVGSSYENLFFRVLNASSRRWQFSDGQYRFTNCLATAGAMNFAAGADTSQYDVHLDINGLTIATDGDNSTLTYALQFSSSNGTAACFGTVTNLRVLAVPASSASEKYGVNITGAGTNTYKDALIFQSCHLYPTTGYSVGNGYVVNIENNNSPVIFRGCHIRALTSATIVPVRIFNSSDVVFEDCLITTSDSNSALIVEDCDEQGVAPIVFRRCTFSTGSAQAIVNLINSDNIVFEDCVVQSFCPAGVLLKVDSCSGVSFIRTNFIGNTTSPVAGEIDVKTSNSITSKPVRFKDCDIELKSGSTALMRRICLSADPSTGGSYGSGNLEIDGLIVRVTHSSGLNDQFFNLRGVDSAKPVLVRNLHFRLGNQVTNTAAACPIIFDGGTGNGNIIIQGLKMTNVSGPATGSSAGASLVTMNRTTIQNGVLQASASGTEPSFTVFIMNDDSVIDGMIYYPTDIPLRGRIHDIQGYRCAIRNCKVQLTNLAASESQTGWFASIGKLGGTFITHVQNNTVRISGTLGSLTSTSAMLLMVTSSLYCVITGNNFDITNQIRFLVASAGGIQSVISNNIHVTSAGGAYPVVILSASASENVVTSNVFIATGGTASITDSGTGNIVANNVLS